MLSWTLKITPDKMKGAAMHSRLFSGLKIGSLELDNRVVMPPMYVGYAKETGEVSQMVLDHYSLMAQSGAAMIVVESTSIDHPMAGGGARTLRADDDCFLDGLEKLAEAIKSQGAVAAIQLNHAGRFSVVTNPLSPTNIDTFGLGRTYKEMDKDDIAHVGDKFAEAAVRAKKAGFDVVELHGATGYLLSQFISPWVNRRTDEYGGSLDNRMRFGLEILKKVRDAVGDMPVGFRFMAHEWLPEGLELVDSLPYARALEKAGAAYLSVSGGSWESFMVPEVLIKSIQPCYMVDLAAAVKKEVEIPVIAAGRIQEGAVAERILLEGKADLIGLARPLWADPGWLEKVRHDREDEIIPCSPSCGDTCMQLVMSFKPAYCTQWSKEKRAEWKAKFE
ncbi:NADH:flavin oxidoreductase [Desulfatibacillum aliphaticivorans]|uniref:NADH:flavin oxidoreductase n=1 Tax=Desulfatibacillum aliphaticivorans TaxID=218208 RepID=UPI00041C35B4|nr:NADH:flavin oxidoreductase [Desulfatibacillum aliphaticivorans]